MKSKTTALIIVLIIVLIAGFFFIYSEFRKMSTEGMECLSHPFIYGAKKVTTDLPNTQMFCSCQIYGGLISYDYSFNEKTENPQPKLDFMWVYNLTEQ